METLVFPFSVLPPTPFFLALFILAAQRGNSPSKLTGDTAVAGGQHLVLLRGDTCVGLLFLGEMFTRLKKFLFIFGLSYSK